LTIRVAKKTTRRIKLSQIYSEVFWQASNAGVMDVVRSLSYHNDETRSALSPMWLLMLLMIANDIIKLNPASIYHFVLIPSAAAAAAQIFTNV
jgi:hypothetical protein